MGAEHEREAPMDVGAQVRELLSEVDGLDPSPDLWQRLSSSIRDDVARRRRRRLVTAGLVLAAWILFLAALGPGVLDTRVVDWRAMELVETTIMLAVVVGVRPLLHDVGRGFVAESFAGDEAAGERFNALLDVAWLLVFSGWVVATIEFAPTVAVGHHVGHQLGQAATRLAGLLLAMGLLHGLTFLVLPVVGLFWTAARVQRAVPRWVVVVVVLGLVPAAFVAVNVVLAVLVAGAAG